MREMSQKIGTSRWIADKQKEVDERITLHQLWVNKKKGGKRADFSSDILIGINFHRCNLKRAFFTSAYLRYCDFINVDLRGADFIQTNLHGCRFQDTDLRLAVLRGANLEEASFQGTDLRETYLPAPTMVLLANWRNRNLSRDLIRELMRYDAANHPDGTVAFNRWSKGGHYEDYPYRSQKIERAANFTEDPNLWEPGPSKSAYELMALVLKECRLWP